MKKVVLVLKTVLFLAILSCCLFVTSLVVERKSSYDKNQMFFNEAKEGHIDAFILGSSHVINGINPIQLFEEYGYTAYNLGGYGSVLLSSYWQFRLALDYCTPKVVIVDAYMLENDVRYVDDPNANVDSDELHLNVDRFPLNKTKYEAINDMFESQEEKYPFYADFIVYHDRWKELDRNDFKRVTGTAEINYLMGGVMEYETHSTDFNYYDFQAEPLDHETVGTTYLRRIIEECQERGISVVVTTLPFLAMQDGQTAAKTAEKIAAEYGAFSVNMLEIPGIIDLNNDMMDAGHLNAVGSQKVTSYLGWYLSQTVDLPDHRGDTAYAKWGESSAKRITELQNMSEHNDNIYAQLMALKLLNGDRTFMISIRGGSAALSDSTLIRQLYQLGAGELLRNAAAVKCSYALISDHGQIYEFAGDGEEQHISTTDAEITYIPVSDIYRVLYCGDDTETNYLYNDEHANADIQYFRFGEGQIASHQYYTSEHFNYKYDQ